MKGTAIAMTLALILAGITAVPLSGFAQPGSPIGAGIDALQTPSADEANATPPGARLAGAVGAQEAEVRGEVESRAFGVALDRAGSDEARSRVVGRQAGDLRERLEELRERKRVLQREHRNGNVSTATYVAELTTLTARTESVRGLANQTHVAAHGLPPEVAERRGVNVTAIGVLERDAANLTGPEVARIARTIAGPDVGKPVGPPVHANVRGNGSAEPPDERSVGPPGDRGNAANRSSGPATGNVTDGVGEVVDTVDNATDGDGIGVDGDGTVPGDAENESDRGASERAMNASERAAAAVDRVEARIADATATIEDAGAGANATALADANAALDDARVDLEAAQSALDDGDAERARRLADRASERVDRAEALLDDAAGGATGLL